MFTNFHQPAACSNSHNLKNYWGGVCVCVRMRVVVGGGTLTLYQMNVNFNSKLIKRRSNKDGKVMKPQDQS